MQSHYISAWMPLLVCASLLGCTTFRKGRGYSIQNDLVYKTADGIELKGTLYLPDGPELKPAVIVVHGGGWTRKSGDLSGVSRELAEAGYAVFSPSYRLAPANRFPKAADDVRDAVNWLKANAAKYGIDPARLAGWGYSAGANLILLVGLDPQLGLKAIVSGGTPADLTVWPKSPLVKGFIGHSLTDRPDLWREASPINHVDAKSPPVFLYHGKGDMIVEFGQMERMRSALAKQNRIVETYAAPRAGHITTYFFNQTSVDLGVAFLNRYVQPVSGK